jgi:hypothetical protein
MNGFEAFARLLGIPARAADEALHSERVAKLVLDRRNFMVASAALAAGTMCSFAQASPLSTIHLLGRGGEILRRWYPGEPVRRYTVINDQPQPLEVKLVLLGQRMPLASVHLAPVVGAGFEWRAMYDEEIVA